MSVIVMLTDRDDCGLYSPFTYAWLKQSSIVTSHHEG